MTPSSDFPFTFDQSACISCKGSCCRWGGYVWINQDEMEEIAKARGMDLGVFADTYVRAAYGNLSLQERLINGEQMCCFFDPYDSNCNIYDHRPKQCRTFPFWEQYLDGFSKLLEICPGVSIKE